MSGTETKAPAEAPTVVVPAPAVKQEFVPTATSAEGRAPPVPPPNMDGLVSPDMLQDDDLFNFVLVNADHISSNDGSLAFMHDSAAKHASPAPPSFLAGSGSGSGASVDAPLVPGAAMFNPAGGSMFNQPPAGTASTLDKTAAATDLAAATDSAGTGTGAAAGRARRGRAVKRRGTGGPGGQQATAADPKANKRLRRLEKNRESARECRRRKKEHLEVLETRVRQLEQEAAVLRERLRATRADAVKDEVEEKKQARAVMRERLERGASDEELASVVGAYREKFSDYGARRQTAVQYHLDQLERLLKPTQVTRMCMWSLHQDDSFYQENSLDPDGETTMWHFLCSELNVTPDQQAKIKKYRHEVRELSKGLRETMDLLQQLRARAQVKNVALDKAMHDLQNILTPKQSAKFILWVDSNPVCMQMLNSLWSVLPKPP